MFVKRSAGVRTFFSGEFCCADFSLRFVSKAAFLFFMCVGAAAVAQQPQTPLTPPPAPAEEEVIETPEQVDVQPLASDAEIANRLTRILNSTDWFVEPEVRVENGVVFLSGQALEPEHAEWAANLARRTESVVAVVNRLELIEAPFWDFTPARDEFFALWREFVRLSPVLILGLFIVLLSWFAAKAISAGSRRLFARRSGNPLLTEVMGRVVTIIILVFGLFIALRITGLTRLALTVAGGTGIAGLILGIAFRDIAENFLASLLISIQSPFQTDDLIEVEGHLGYVQKVTTRGTVLMAFDGNYIRIPNSTIYKSNIRNYSANSHYRQDFAVGIGYETPIVRAQEIGLKVMRNHPAILNDPEPMILVESLGASTINLRAYFWIDTTKHSFLRVRSSTIRLVLKAYEEAGVALPDAEREIVFPRGVPIRRLRPDEAKTAEAIAEPAGQKTSSDAVSTGAEGDLRSEADEIESQARKSRTPEEGRNLLGSPAAAKSKAARTGAS